MSHRCRSWNNCSDLQNGNDEDFTFSHGLALDKGIFIGTCFRVCSICKDGFQGQLFHGSRFGGGIKQLEPVGPNGEIIMDYSIYDALEASFDKIVFIIRKDIEKDFREIIGNRIEKITNVEYAFQALGALTQGFSVLDGKRSHGVSDRLFWRLSTSFMGHSS